MNNQLIMQICLFASFALLFIIYVITKFATYSYIMGHLSIYILTIAKQITIKEFKQNKKQIYTKQGNYTINFNKAVQNKVNDLNIKYQFYSKDFYYFYKHHRPILKSRITRLLKLYMKQHSNISLSNNFNSMTPEQFFKLRKTIQGDMVGVYVIYNKNRKMYYVGQATRLFFRVNQHFTGHGNGDVYGDFKRGGDKFTIKLLPLVNSGYYDLDKFEKDMITKYDAYNNGYNKTAGNGD